MKKITLAVTIVLFILIGYAYVVNQVGLNRKVLQPEELVINQFPNLFPSINWSQVKESSGDTANKPTSYSEGTVVVSEMGDREGVYDSTVFVTKLELMGWSKMPPDGASGPFTSYTRLSKQINGSEQIMKVMVENTTMSRGAIGEQLSTKCPCDNIITIYLEK